MKEKVDELFAREYPMTIHLMIEPAQESTCQ